MNPPIREALTNLENLVANLERLSMPQRSPELVQLAHRAVEAMSSREKEDIVEWARRLAEDTVR